MDTKRIDLIGGADYSNIDISSPYKWVGVMKTPTDPISTTPTTVDFRTSLGQEVLDAIRGDVFPIIKGARGRFKVRCSYTGTVTLVFGDKAEEIAKLVNNAGVGINAAQNSGTITIGPTFPPAPPYPSIYPAEIINAGVSSLIAANVDQSIRVGQPNLNDNIINLGTGNTWAFYYFGNAFGSFNGIWFEVTHIPTGGRGLILVPSHDLTDQSANPNFNNIGECGYLKTRAGMVPINLNDGSYIPAIGDVFYLPFSGRNSIYYQSPGAWGPEPGFNFQYHFNYGNEPCARVGVSTQTLANGLVLNSGDPVNLPLDKKPIGARGFFLYVTGALDLANNCQLNIYGIDPLSGKTSIHNVNVFYSPSLSTTDAWVFQWNFIDGQNCPYINNAAGGNVAKSLLAVLQDVSATVLTPDVISIELEWIY